MNDPASQTSRVLVQIDNAATVLFIFEMVLKMAAFGFFVTKPTIGCAQGSVRWSGSVSHGLALQQWRRIGQVDFEGAQFRLLQRKHE